MPATPRRIALVLAATLALTAVHDAPVLAINYKWTGAGVSNGFFDAGNWTPGGYPDDGGDTAIFDIAGTHRAYFNNSLINNNFEVSAGVVTLDLFSETEVFPQDRPHVYTLDAASGGSANITSFPGALFAVQLTIEGGLVGIYRSEVRTSSFLHIGRDANTKGTLELDDVNWISSHITYVGLFGRGTTILDNNGDMTNSTGVIGLFSGSRGTVTVGRQSRWSNNSSLTVGGQGLATMTIEDGGIVSNHGDGFIASSAGSNSVVTVQDGRWFNRASLYVGGTSTSTGGTARLTIQDTTLGFLDTEVEVDNDMLIRSTGTVDMLDGGTLDVTGLLTMDAGSELNLNGSNAVLNAGSLTGGANTLNWTAGAINITNADFTVDANAGSYLFISTDMSLDVSDTLRIGPDAGGALSIVNAAKVTTASVEIGNTPAATSTTSITVDGLGTTLTATGDLAMGSTGGGSGAQLVVTDQGIASNDNAFVSSLPGQHSELLMQSLGGGTAEWNSTGSVYLGGDKTTLGGTARLDVNVGGLVTVAGTLRVWDNATVTVDAGLLTTALLHHSGTFNYAGPLDLTGAGPITALDLDGGTITAEEINLGANDFTGNGTLTGDVIAQGIITANGNLSLGDPSSFTGLTLTGPLNVGTHTVTLNKAGFFNIGQFTTIAGGTLNVPNGSALPVGNTILAHGAITGRLVQQSGSTIIAN